MHGAGLAAAGRERARLIAARKLVPLPTAPLPDKLYAVIDGTGVPMTSALGVDGLQDRLFAATLIPRSQAHKD